MQEFWVLIRQHPRIWLSVAIVAGIVSCLVYYEISRRNNGKQQSPCRQKMPTLDEEAILYDEG